MSVHAVEITVLLKTLAHQPDTGEEIHGRFGMMIRGIRGTCCANGAPRKIAGVRSRASRQTGREDKESCLSFRDRSSCGKWQGKSGT